MANSTVQLLRYARIPGVGWRRGKAVLNANKTIKPDYIIFGGEQVYAKDGNFVLRHYAGKKPVFTPLPKGTEGGDALKALRDLKAKLEAVNDGEDVVIDDAPKTLQKLRGEFLHKKRHGSKDNIYKYTETVDGFLKSCKKTYPRQIVESDVEDYCDELEKNDGYHPTTRADRYMRLRGFLAFCGKAPDSFIEKETHQKLKEKPDPDPVEYTKEKMQKLLGDCNQYFRLVFMFLVLTGLRKREAMFLTWSDMVKTPGGDGYHIHVAAKEFTYKGKFIKFRLKTKWAKRYVPLKKSLADELLAWRKLNPNTKFIFGTRNDLPNRRWLDYLKKYAKKAGLNCGECKTCVERGECQFWFLHGFRATFASSLYYGGMKDLKKLGALMGHSPFDLSTLASRYLRKPNPQELQAGVEMLTDYADTTTEVPPQPNQ